MTFPCGHGDSSVSVVNRLDFYSAIDESDDWMGSFEPAK